MSGIIWNLPLRQPQGEPDMDQPLPAPMKLCGLFFHIQLHHLIAFREPRLRDGVAVCPWAPVAAAFPRGLG